MSDRFKFDRMELAGSLGDLGALLPIAIAMVLFNGLSPVGLFLSIGLFYILSGSYFGMTVPVQPMKVIGAYAIATAMTAEQILASGFLMGVFLLIVGMTGTIDVIRKFTPKSVVRGVQLSTGALLISGGVKFIMGTSKYQALQAAVEPHLTIQALAGIPISVIIGIIGAIATLLLLDNRKFPAGLMVVIGGLFAGLAILFGNSIVQVFNLIPMSILGVLLIFAGAQLTLAMMDLDRRKDLFVATLILGITLASNLAAGFIAGMVVAHMLRWDKLSV
ncbi:molybdate transporter family protein [Desulfotignum phosphitoxidans]|uniref:SulfP-like sulfate permease n=1 Tax=Desulfotignum phosphitoxidans DSM 13687 TaxID=1286635 RepID=S0G0V9_9BACT|nr:molybdate transporter family protein [Desulfotignum phosphitoxidans]EMS77301.1 SulfP-like sulfate permease [Desulfotignum phosphitoxidans DSM 13687]